MDPANYPLAKDVLVMARGSRRMPSRVVQIRPGKMDVGSV